MNTITNREWIKWYETVGRKPIAHLSKEQRKRIVRGCQGKVVYSSHEEAKPVVDSLPLIDGMFPRSYRCQLCHGIHIGNSATRKAETMSTSLVSIEAQATSLQVDLKNQIESFFKSLPELKSLVSMSEALVIQSKAIKVGRNDPDDSNYRAATEQTQALKSVVDEITELFEPFAAGLFKAHRTVTKLRGDNLEAAEGEVKRLKTEREGFAAEQERMRREAAQKAQQEAYEREQTRLMEEARQVAATGNAAAAEEILEEAVNLEVAPVVLPSTVPEIQGTSFRTKWNWEMVDATKLKAEFITPKEKEIGQLVRSMNKAAETLVGSGAIRVWESKIIVG
jgi:hypothetical protein